MIAASGLVPATEAAAGDMILCASAPGQLHLMIDSGIGFIHADALARRVVERTGPVPWRVLGRWRLATPPIDDEEEMPWRP